MFPVRRRSLTAWHTVSLLLRRQGETVTIASSSSQGGKVYGKVYTLQCYYYGIVGGKYNFTGVVTDWWAQGYPLTKEGGAWRQGVQCKKFGDIAQAKAFVSEKAKIPRGEVLVFDYRPDLRDIDLASQVLAHQWAWQQLLDRVKAKKAAGGQSKGK